MLQLYRSKAWAPTFLICVLCKAVKTYPQRGVSLSSHSSNRCCGHRFPATWGPWF